VSIDAETPSDGHECRDRGCALATRRYPAAVLETQVALLRAVQAHGEATIDDATATTDLRVKYPRRGPWRGAAVLALRSRGVIVPTGERRTSLRPHRHAGGNPVWTANDPAKLAAEIIDLEQQLATVVASEPSDGTPSDYCI
jgi:hypothetical protein